MYCWSCGEYLLEADTSCSACGAAAAAPPRRQPSRLMGIRSCPACGYRGDGVPYFSRVSHAALLVGAAVFTYGLGGLGYWLVKRKDRICPSCGLSWDRARVDHGGAGQTGPGQQVERRDEEVLDLPRRGLGRRVFGVILALVASLLLGLGIVSSEGVLAVVSAVSGLAGASFFAWGWRSLQRRREAILHQFQRSVLRLAHTRGGQLTATDVASELDLSLRAAERVLLSLDDGFRVRSDVTDEGLLVFEFPEIRYQLKAGRASDGLAGRPSLSQGTVRTSASEGKLGTQGSEGAAGTRPSPARDSNTKDSSSERRSRAPTSERTSVSGH